MITDAFFALVLRFFDDDAFFAELRLRDGDALRFFDDDALRLPPPPVTADVIRSTIDRGRVPARFALPRFAPPDRPPPLISTVDRSTTTSGAHEPA